MKTHSNDVHTSGWAILLGSQRTRRNGKLSSECVILGDHLLIQLGSWLAKPEAGEPIGVHQSASPHRTSDSILEPDPSTPRVVGVQATTGYNVVVRKREVVEHANLNSKGIPRSTIGLLLLNHVVREQTQSAVSCP